MDEHQSERLKERVRKIGNDTNEIVVAESLDVNEMPSSRPELVLYI